MRYRQFWTILFFTAIAWLLYTMSEPDDFSLPVKVEWTGYDTARCVVSHADTLLPISVQVNGFQAFRLTRRIKRQPWVVSVSNDTSITVNADVFDLLSEIYSIPNSRRISSTVPALTLTLQQRQSKAFVPQLRNVEFRFDDQCGLSGEPRIEPDTVYLYGSSASLDKVGELFTSAAVVDHIADSGYYTLSLEPVWLNYRDLRPSTDVVRIYLPVQRYVLTTVSVPVDVQGIMGNQQAMLYPERVDVQVWAPESSYRDVQPSQFQAIVQYDPTNASLQLPVTLTRFPADVRVRTVTPASLQYVLIQR